MKKIIMKMSWNRLPRKVLSIVLILTILIIPFQTLLNVKAEGTTITTDETTLEGKSGFKHVTNTTTLQVYGEENTNYSAYKILDIYYNETTNEMTYGFTSDFKSFIEQLSSSDDFYNLTIEDYQELTSDNSGDSITTTSTLNKLVSKYATYLKKNSTTTTNLVSISGEGGTSDSRKGVVEVGSYLVLPTATVPAADEGVAIYTYGVSVANVVFEASRGEYTLSSYYSIYLKHDYIATASILINDSLEKIWDGDASVSQDIVYSASKDLYLCVQLASFGRFAVPTNTHSSILNNSTIMNKIKTYEIIFPTGLTYDLNELYCFNTRDDRNQKVTVSDNSIYKQVDGSAVKIADFIQNTSTNSITFYNIQYNEENEGDEQVFFFKLKTNVNTKVGTTTNAANLSNYGNTITTKFYSLKDAYVDISNMSQEEAEAAVLGVGTQTNTVYTYGVKVTNKNNSTLLNGAKFQVCLDESCNTKVGEEFEITSAGTYTFKGLNDTDTYYLKQTKASSGYKIANTITLSPTSLNKEVGYYDVEVTSTKMGLLPSTGGLGTILYTFIGLFIVGIGSYLVVSYCKKQIQNS